ncbi:putative Histidine kinase [Desulfamplus magnetovallimortis]|uniref:histidine kinase n=1 Tax=Desulfamplus magnetovallimortis TaxID=1246637 RepID=A0A1W1H6F2_9BACT|nr:ATP-binding protein [Desulfamplus magnetovallimortis]SLM28016.1 putative Histidine kinase [Desulfamplus magnetovallimortis]
MDNESKNSSYEQILHYHSKETKRPETEPLVSRLPFILDHLPAFIFILDKNHSIQYANRFFLQHFGHNNGNNCYQIKYKRTEPCEHCSIFHYNDKQNCQKAEWHCGYDQKHYELCNYSLTDERDNSNLFKIAIDITTHKNVAKELEKSKKRLEMTFNAISDWICIIDKDHKILFSNPSVEKIVGLRENEIIGECCHHVIHKTRQTPLNCPLEKAARTKKRETLEFQIEDGRWLQTTVDPFEYNENGEQAFVHTVRDITPMKQHEQDTIAARKAEAFSILSGGLAHDYNNLLTIIWGNISLLKDSANNLYDSRLLQAVEKACEQARNLTHNFITLSHCSMLSQSSTNINDIIDKAIKNTIFDNSINISIHNEADSPFIEADPDLLTAAIQNIITNSIEAMPNGGDFTITTKSAPYIPGLPQNKKYLKLSLTDTGKGIPKSDLHKVFDPYFSSKQLGVRKGMGLGLAISKSIIEKHGGSININSKLNKGSTITITLPMPEIDTDACKWRKIPSDLLRPTILFMEDDHIIREMIGNMLKSIKYGALQTADGQEAVDIYRQTLKNGKPIDLILLDQNIKGGMGGIETLKELRKLGFQKRAIVVTGSPSCPAIIDFKKYGFDASLLKPFTIDELEAVIKANIGKNCSNFDGVPNPFI